MVMIIFVILHSAVLNTCLDDLFSFFAYDQIGVRALTVPPIDAIIMWVVFVVGCLLFLERFSSCYSSFSLSSKTNISKFQFYLKSVSSLLRMLQEDHRFISSWNF